jgi:hypothetical protein
MEWVCPLMVTDGEATILRLESSVVGADMPSKAISPPLGAGPFFIWESKLHPTARASELIIATAPIRVNRDNHLMETLLSFTCF